MSYLIISHGCTPNKAYTSQDDYISGDLKAEAWVLLRAVINSFEYSWYSKPSSSGKDQRSVNTWGWLCWIMKETSVIESWGMSQLVQINVMKYSGFFLASVQFCVQFHKDILILKHVWYNSSLIGITWDSGLSHLKVTIPGAVHQGQRALPVWERTWAGLQLCKELHWAMCSPALQAFSSLP